MGKLEIIVYSWSVRYLKTLRTGSFVRPEAVFSYHIGVSYAFEGLLFGLFLYRLCLAKTGDINL